MGPLLLYGWGGLASQLSSVVYACWLTKNTDRQVQLRLSSGGTTYRKIQVQDLIQKSGAHERISVRSTGNDMFRSYDAENDSQTQRFVRRLVASGLPALVNQWQRFSPFHVVGDAIMKEDLERVGKYTRLIRGYPLDWQLIESECTSLSTILAASDYTNFLEGGGQDDFVAIHWRLGDYRRHPEAARTHGLIPVVSLENALSQMQLPNVPVKVFTDEPDFASRELHSSGLGPRVSVQSGDIWSDLWSMSRAKWFIGSHSAVSLWAALGIRRGNPEARILMPDQWFLRRPRQARSIRLPTFETYAAGLIDGFSPSSEGVST